MANFSNSTEEKTNPFFKEKIVKISLFFSLALNFILWLILGWQVKDFPELIPLHYNIYFGIDSFGTWYQIFLMPLLGLVIIVLNFFLAIFIGGDFKIH